MSAHGTFLVPRVIMPVPAETGSITCKYQAFSGCPFVLGFSPLGARTHASRRCGAALAWMHIVDRPPRVQLNPGEMAAIMGSLRRMPSGNLYEGFPCVRVGDYLLPSSMDLRALSQAQTLSMKSVVDPHLICIEAGLGLLSPSVRHGACLPCTCCADRTQQPARR